MGGRRAAPARASPTSPSWTWPSERSSPDPADPRGGRPPGERRRRCTVRKVSRPDVTERGAGRRDRLRLVRVRGRPSTLRALRPAAGLPRRPVAAARRGAVARASCAGGGSPATEPGRATRPDLHIVDGARMVPTTEAGHFAVQVSTMPAHVDDIRGRRHGARVRRRAARPRARPGGRAAAARAGRRHRDPALPGRTGRAGRAGGQPVRRSGSRSTTCSSGREVGDTVAPVRGPRRRRSTGSPRCCPTARAAASRSSAGVGMPEPRLTVGARPRSWSGRPAPGWPGWSSGTSGRRSSTWRWTDDGRLELAGSYHEPSGADGRAGAHATPTGTSTLAVPMTRDGDRFSARLQPHDVRDPRRARCRWPRASGTSTPGSGRRAARCGSSSTARCSPTCRQYVGDGGRDVMVRDVEFDSLAIVVPPRAAGQRDRGRAGQRRLQTEDYPAYLPQPRARPGALRRLRARRLRRRRPRPARGAAAPRHRPRRAVERRRRAGRAPRRACAPWPATAATGTRPLARARYVVAARLPRRRRTSPSRGRQRVLQTWHGSPVTAVGLDDEHAGSRLGRGWEDRVRREAAQWDVLLASGAESAARCCSGPSATTAPGADRPGCPATTSSPPTAPTEPARAAVRERLGIAAGRAGRALRPDPPPGPRGAPDRYQLDLQMDLDEAPGRARRRPRAAGAAAPQGRRHACPRPTASGGRRGALAPDARELLLAADVLVTDYSSVMVDFALTGRPMVFWTAGRASYYREHLRRLYLEPGRAARPDRRQRRRRSCSSRRTPGRRAGGVRHGVPRPSATAARRRATAKAAARAVDALLECLSRSATRDGARPGSPCA